MNRITHAKELFQNDHNCAQSVLISFADFLEKEEQELKAVAAGFGGGMGSQQLTCGAVTGAYMVLSIYASGREKENNAAKSLSGELIGEFTERFLTRHNDLSCRSLLGADMHTPEGRLKIIRENMHETVCLRAVQNAVTLLEEMLLNEQGRREPSEGG